MRISLALSVIFISIQYGRCKLELKRDKEIIVDIDSPELHQSQYHTADFDTSAYNYGYAVEPNGQFHHETRGGDGVTYGCYGYIDSDDLLKVTHYVADSQGYRTLEHEQPVLVYPVNENNVDAQDKPYKPKGVMLDWKDLYFPIGCGMVEGGVVLNAPVIRTSGGAFQQLGETKFPVQPSPEPKVILPRIPFNVNSAMKTEPTKLIPISTAISPNTNLGNPKTSAPIAFSTSNGVHPSTETTQRPGFNGQSTPTKTSNINAHVNGPEYDTKISYRQNQHSTIQPAVSPSRLPIQPAVSPSKLPTQPAVSPSKPPTQPAVSPSKPPAQPAVSPSKPSTRPGTSSSPFRESVKVNGHTTVEAPSDKLILKKVTAGPFGQSDYTDELLPPHQTTIGLDTQTTIGLPINSFDPGNDLNVINSYANPDARTPTQPNITTTVPTQSHSFSNNYNFNGPSTIAGTKYPAIDSTEKISPIRPNKFDGFKFNTQPTTETPINLVTESNPESTNANFGPETIDEESLSTPADGGRTTPYANQRPTDISFQTFGVSNSIASQRPGYDSYTTSNVDVEYETTTLQSIYPGIGDYSKPLPGFEFNIPTRAPNQASTPKAQPFVTVSNTPKVQSFVTVSSLEPVKSGVTPQNLVDVNLVANKAPTYDKTIPFTNGPHGAEYQLGSRNPHSQFAIGNDNLNFLNPIKQSRKDADGNNRPISLITPLTHLTISGTFPSTNNDGAEPSTVQQPSTPNNLNKSPAFGSQYSVSQVHNPNRQSTLHPERESSQPEQPSGFFTVTTPKNEPTRGIITHMNAISQTRFQSSRVTPSAASIALNDEGPEITHTTRPEFVTPTESPFLYTRSRTTSANGEITPYQGESRPGYSSPELITKTPGGELTIYSGFGQKTVPGTNPKTTSFTAYHPESTSRPLNEVDGGSPPTNRINGFPVPFDNAPNQPKFVLRPTARPASNPNNRQSPSNFNGYPDAVNRNANFYPDSSPQKAIDNNQNNIQPENKYVNTKKEFIPQYNPSSTPIPGSLGTAIGVYPPNVDELSPEIPNFNIAISKWPFYILPFPFTNGNLMPFPLLNGMPIQFGGNILPQANINLGTNLNTDYAQGASSVGIGGNGAPTQSICSWLDSFIKARKNATNTAIPTNENGETLEISNLQVNIKNPQLQINQNQIPFGFVGFIPIIAVPNCQHNVDPNTLPTSIQIPTLCTQLSQLLGGPVNTKDTNQSSSST